MPRSELEFNTEFFPELFAKIKRNIGKIAVASLAGLMVFGGFKFFKSLSDKEAAQAAGYVRMVEIEQRREAEQRPGKNIRDDLRKVQALEVNGIKYHLLSEHEVSFAQNGISYVLQFNSGAVKISNRHGNISVKTFGDFSGAPLVENCRKAGLQISAQFNERLQESLSAGEQDFLEKDTRYAESVRGSMLSARLRGETFIRLYGSASAAPKVK